jgi:mannose-6-phosphate isomerase-like protein (cupin superfamily)
MSNIRRVEKPWGYEEIFAHTSRYVAKFLIIFKGRRLSLQYHEKKDESLFLLSGRMHLLLGKKEPLEERILEPGDCFFVPAGMLHRFTAIEDCRLVEVSTPELGDVVRVEDDYGREGRTD